MAADLNAERALREQGRRMFAPIAETVEAVIVGAISRSRVYSYEKALFDFDSKHITKPGNKLRIRVPVQHLHVVRLLAGVPVVLATERARRPDRQRRRHAARARSIPSSSTSSAVTTTRSPSDPAPTTTTSGTAALLETARALAGHPMPATIIFASFTGEEAGLLGSREFVRRAVQDKLKIVGALNNDMIGWANDNRLDNTIRYSNPGIRDIQHGAAIEFTNLITYDALYYKSTDAAAYYDAYGDIVGGIGSYPVLGNPHYHQSHDLLEDHQPSARRRGREDDGRHADAARVEPVAHHGTAGDRVGTRRGAVLDARSGNRDHRLPRHVGTGRQSRAALAAGDAAAAPRSPAFRPARSCRVKAVNAKGLEGWDWAAAWCRCWYPWP